VDVDSARLAVVDLATDYERVRPRFHLKPCYAVVVDVVRLKVSLTKSTD
jgi:hypothetical protein